MEEVRKKYELTDETITWNGKTLYRIKALVNIYKFRRSYKYAVRSGELGGYVESEDNLSHDGLCWIYQDAKVYDNAVISENAKVTMYAEVYENARISGDVVIQDHAMVYGNAQVYGSAQASGNSQIYEYATVRGYSKLFDDCIIRGNADLLHHAHVGAKSIICGNATIFGIVDIYNDGFIIGGNAYISDINHIIYGCFTVGDDICKYVIYRNRNRRIGILVEGTAITIDELLLLSPDEHPSILTIDNILDRLLNLYRYHNEEKATPVRSKSTVTIHKKKHHVIIDREVKKNGFYRKRNRKIKKFK